MRKFIFISTVGCVAYDIFAFEYQRRIGTDIMFGYVGVYILAAILIYTGIAYGLVYHTPRIKDSTTWKVIFIIPLAGYVLLHAFLLLTLLLQGIMMLFD